MFENKFQVRTPETCRDSIDSLKNEGKELNKLNEPGIKRAKENKAKLSEIIEVLNERFGTEFEQADKLFFIQIEE